jgi:hypothetical protein
MKKLLAALCYSCALVLAVQAQDAKPKHKMTAEQKALNKEMTEKYDTNKDGKLNKEEKSKMSAEDKAKLEKAGLGHKKKKQGETK